ncbi:MAG: 2-oxoacid:ferredoxin oxidoreductase subunit beta, partial [Rhodospirillales bacterium]|nr:2-oxoacid:ferredoxin oxidoreductase subunit beta [Rhodospirillales bacterium]
GQASPTTSPDWEKSKLTPHGTGVSPFQPLAIALASGANYIARGFSGDPNGVARLIAEAIQHPGFSLVQVLSPCVTFRPEQRDWKEITREATVPYTDDTGRAARRLMTDDGFNTGVLFKGNRPIYQPSLEQSSTTEDLERAFQV